jgi:hypothetical protein
MQGIIHSCLSENSKIPHIMSDLSVPHEGEGQLSFHFKDIYKAPSDRLKEERGSVSSCSILQLPKVLW